MPDDLRRLIDRDIAENLSRFRDSDFETRLRKRLVEAMPVPAPKTRRLVPAVVWGAGAALVLAAALIIPWGKKRTPFSVSVADLESALRAAPGWRAFAADRPATAPAAAESALGHTFAAALEKGLLREGDRAAALERTAPNLLTIPPAGLKRTIEILIRDRAIERVLIRSSIFNKEV